jgi:tetratricopeptide (TPR) repeat protein
MPAPIRRLVVALLLCAGFAATLSAQARFRAMLDPDFREWLTAVEAHQPGTLDLHATSIAHWPFKRLTRVLNQITDEIPPEWILKAAALYLDVATYMPIEGRPMYPTEGRSLNAVDGRPTHTSSLDTQVWWARNLVNRLLGRDRLDPADRARALAWYNDVSALFAGRLQLADLQWHLEGAAVHFPDDPVVLFDRGCVAETLASPVVQHAAEARVSSLPASLRASRKFPVRTSREHLDQAAGLFRRSIEAAPSGEAHARFGRLLIERGRVDDAIRHLQSATNDPDDMVSYYGWLFLGQAYATTGAWDEAERALDEALKRFPEAQSAHLARSRLHIRRGDAATARDSLSPVVDPRRVIDDRTDPWWRYLWCRGRNVERAASHVLPAP